MKHLLRAILFFLFGQFIGLKNQDSPAEYVLVRVGLPLGLTGRFPLPLLFGAHAPEGALRRRRLTVARSRDLFERLQAGLLRRAFGQKALEAYRQVLQARIRQKNAERRLALLRRIDEMREGMTRKVYRSARRRVRRMQGRIPDWGPRRIEREVYAPEGRLNGWLSSEGREQIVSLSVSEMEPSSDGMPGEAEVS